MSDRIRVYVAGPISKGNLNKNVQQAVDAGIILIHKGFAPFVPHLSCYMGGCVPDPMPFGTTHDDWMSVDLPWVKVSQALLRLPGESKGADMEVSCANSYGIPVFLSIDDLLDYFEIT